jgi:hypothetical protein
LAFSGAHDEFLELCALSASGELNRQERERLETHLADCASCRRAQQEYAAIVEHGLPKMAAELGSSSIDSESSGSADQHEAEAEFFRRIQVEDVMGAETAEPDAAESGEDREGANGGEEEALFEGERISLAALESTWRKVWALYAAAIVSFIVLGLTAYRTGVHRNNSQAPAKAALASAPAPVPENDRLLEQQLSDTGHQLELQRAQIAQRDRSIADLRRRLELQSSDLAQATAALANEKMAMSVSERGQQFAQKPSPPEHQLESTQAEAQSLRAELTALETKSAQETIRAGQLEAKVNDLTQALQARESEVDQQRQLLAHDRDIRDLMGARDLYIAEVYDVERSGEMRKPYGRLFYTKEKSLVFYAYDLDQQAGLRDASTFQAWGRRGPDRERALNLGIFFQDNAAKKRWVLKFNDPKTLSQIDAVFVTVEPNGGSSKPSSKPLLFAYLRIEPNHP